MSPRKQIERTLVDNIFQTIEIIVSKVQTALQKEVVALFPNHTSPADKIVVDKRLIPSVSQLLRWLLFLSESARISSQAPASRCTVEKKTKKQDACSLGSLIINSTLATFEMAQTLSLSIINVLYCNQRGSWFWDQISLHWPCACSRPPSPRLSAPPQPREWPWTGADLAASPRSDVIRLSRKEKGWKGARSPSRFRLVSGALSRG